MLSGELTFMKRHQGNVVIELQTAIIDSINSLEDNFNKLVYHSQQMQLIDLSTKEVAELVGRMYIEENVITSTQLNIVKRELEKPSYEDFKEDTLWSLYNHCTHSFKEATPMNYLKQHLNLHNFIEEEFGL